MVLVHVRRVSEWVVLLEVLDDVGMEGEGMLVCRMWDPMSLVVVIHG